ncbi:Stomatal closure-related actin-binding protein 1 [Quillaja saponaria]|uniref:Stomatal closure-related actin-binding protein 1 n=1 Tax=Quillaja saponaria TaxID=32244 RepID=A0AAD7Q800_QUISA|nr:Stomatal closure-related actin-binding protein 1 [Quillaja saponaria]KAJ7976566.1 Stomatal closure-related actin-binding protein 1 [Quillaja saponaria]
MKQFFLFQADVSFTSSRFPKYKLGADNQILEHPKEDNLGPPLKDVVEQEACQLLDQHKRLSVRDLASKFDKNLAAAAKLSDEAKIREVASLEGHVLLKKLRDALEFLRGRVAGRNKGGCGESYINVFQMIRYYKVIEWALLSFLVEALAVKLTQNEGELIQEKFEVKKLANFLKQASEDAKRLVNQEKSFACAEIESARSVVLRIGKALEEQDRNYEASKIQNMDELLEEVQEARRIKLLHQPSKVMDMEHELRALRDQIRDKSIVSVKLQRELTMSKRDEENKYRLYMLDGSETLGSCLRLQPCSNGAPHLSKCSFLWYRLSSDASWREVISGANKSIYAPDPFDVGRILQADIVSNGQKITVTTAGPIEPVSGLGSHVVISKMNGQDHPSHSVHAFHVGKMRIKLCRGWITKAREIYSPSMQLCGVRGDVSNAAKVLFWQPRRGLSFLLTFGSERDRNAAIMIARKYALDCHVVLAGPDDQV